jgi:hypothetical protein
MYAAPIDLFLRNMGKRSVGELLLSWSDSIEDLLDSWGVILAAHRALLHQRIFLLQWALVQALLKQEQHGRTQSLALCDDTLMQATQTRALFEAERSLVSLTLLELIATWTSDLAAAEIMSPVALPMPSALQEQLVNNRDTTSGDNMEQGTVHLVSGAKAEAVASTHSVSLSAWMNHAKRVQSSQCEAWALELCRLRLSIAHAVTVGDWVVSDEDVLNTSVSDGNPSVTNQGTALLNSESATKAIIHEHMKGILVGHLQSIFQGYGYPEYDGRDHPFSILLQKLVSFLTCLYEPRGGMILSLAPEEACNTIRQDILLYRKKLSSIIMEWPKAWVKALDDWGATALYMRPSETFQQVFQSSAQTAGNSGSSVEAVMSDPAYPQLLGGAWQESCRLARMVSSMFNERDFLDVCNEAIDSVFFSKLGKPVELSYRALNEKKDKEVNDAYGTLWGVTTTQLDLPESLRCDAAFLGEVPAVPACAFLGSSITTAVALRRPVPLLPISMLLRPHAVLEEAAIILKNEQDGIFAQKSEGSFPHYARGSKDIPAAFAPFLPAIHTFQLMPFCVSPTAKLRLLTATVDILCRCVAIHGKGLVFAQSRHPKQGALPPIASSTSPINADDLLGLLTVVVVHAAVPGLISAIDIIHDFASETLLIERPGFLLTSLQACCFYTTTSEVRMRLTCGNCEGERNPVARLACITCGRRLCAECDTEIHRQEGCEGHQRETIPDDPSSAADVKAERRKPRTPVSGSPRHPFSPPDIRQSRMGSMTERDEDKGTYIMPVSPLLGFTPTLHAIGGSPTDDFQLSSNPNAPLGHSRSTRTVVACSHCADEPLLFELDLGGPPPPPCDVCKGSGYVSVSPMIDSVTGQVQSSASTALGSAAVSPRAPFLLISPGARRYGAPIGKRN